jgi:hypothetical protein
LNAELVGGVGKALGGGLPVLQLRVSGDQKVFFVGIMPATTTGVRQQGGEDSKDGHTAMHRMIPHPDYRSVDNGLQGTPVRPALRPLTAENPHTTMKRHHLTL